MPVICSDVDECVTGQAKCARFRKCVNTFGSFVCRCHEGFELKHIDGKYHCTGVFREQPHYTALNASQTLNVCFFQIRSFLLFAMTSQDTRNADVHQVLMGRVTTANVSDCHLTIIHHAID